MKFRYFHDYANPEKLRTCERDILEIINLTNCRTCSFINKYIHEHTFLVSSAREAI